MEQSSSSRKPADEPTIWGLRPIAHYRRYWAAGGAQVIEQGGREEPVDNVAFYLLTQPDSLVVFPLRSARTRFRRRLQRNGRTPILFLEISDQRRRGYREIAVTDEGYAFKGFQRLYNGVDLKRARVALTTDPTVARAWSDLPASAPGWSTLRERFPEHHYPSSILPGRVRNAASAHDLMQCIKDLLEVWPSPAVAIPRVRQRASRVWADPDAEIEAGADFTGPVWIGAGRRVGEEASVVGPAVLWDDPAARPEEAPIPWPALGAGGRAWPFRRRASRLRDGHPRRWQPPAHESPPAPTHRLRTKRLPGKRAFDIVFSLLVLACTLPVYPLLMLLIILEDGWPVFFVHQRQSFGGKRFPCFKLRTMRKDAHRMRDVVEAKNQVDGPQVYIKDDPRLLRIGRWYRKLNVDELPQFLNVLVGHMSVVGPRPSPYEENQFCPPWQEARLSVRPGITGLWQVMRTRRKGLDFQEWIRYDIEYVENASWGRDLRIIWKTIVILLRGRDEGKGA
jgi:lipopolysaccharide/colanic/teichoic acid biosynthesis glycosyltransferase